MSRFRRIIAPLVLFALFEIGGAVQAEDNRDSLVQRDRDLLRPGTERDLSASQPAMLPVRPFQPLTSEIHLRTAGRRAAALRLAEEGRSFLRNRRPEKALVRLETSMALEASPYTYYYLALAHARLGHYRQTLNFLEVAETWLGLDPAWAAEISNLRNSICRQSEDCLRKGLANVHPEARGERAVRDATGPSEAEPDLFPSGLFFLLLGVFLWIAWSWNRAPALRVRSKPFSAGLGTGRQLETLRQIRGLWARK